MLYGNDVAFFFILMGFNVRSKNMNLIKELQNSRKKFGLFKKSCDIRFCKAEIAIFKR